MGQLEESIVASLERLAKSDPECGDCMFVFPTSLMSRLKGFEPVAGLEARVDDEVLMVRRPRGRSVPA